MRTYVFISFCILCLGVVVKLLQLSVYDYPRIEQKKIGMEIATVLEQLALAFWAGISLWW